MVFSLQTLKILIENNIIYFLFYFLQNSLDDDEDDDSPIIRGFADDEPLVVS